jgi:SseB protein C-terminal domain/SseB protein N-terminal domain
MQATNELEHMLIVGATEPSARSTFYRLLLESPLFAINASNDRPVPASSGQVRVAGEHEVLQLQAMNVNGTPHVVIFTSEQLLQRAINGQRQYVSLAGRDLLGALRGSHLILNPGLDYSKQITPAEIAAIFDGALLRARAHTVPQGVRIRLCQPARYPQALVDTLNSLFRTTKGVRAAYLGLMQEADSDVPPHIVVGIEHKGNWEALVPEVVAAIRGVPCADPPIDVVSMDDGPVAKYLRSASKPFYKRPIFGLL